MMYFNDGFIRESIVQLNLSKVQLFNDDQYYFQDDIDSLVIDNSKVDYIIEKFLYNYLIKINYLNKIDSDKIGYFIDWYNENGKNQLIPLFDQICYEKLDVNRLVKIFVNYDILLEQAIDEENEDSLINLLIDIPKGIYGKLQ